MYECKIQTPMTATTVSDDYDEGGSSSGGVANKEMDDVPPTIEILAKQALPLLSVQQLLELG